MRSLSMGLFRPPGAVRLPWVRVKRSAASYRCHRLCGVKAWSGLAVAHLAARPGVPLGEDVAMQDLTPTV